MKRDGAPPSFKFLKKLTIAKPMQKEEIEDKKYRLHPLAYMKKDKGKSILLKFSPIDFEVEKRQYVHPAVAVLIALFDGKRTVKEIVKALSIVAKISDDDAWRDVISLLKGELTSGEKWLVEAEESERPLFEKSYNPLDFIDIPQMGESRCDTKLKFPYVLNYLCTFRCSVKCIYCYAQSYDIPPPEEMDWGRIREIIDEAKEIEVLHIYLGGGYPLCSKNFWKVLPYIIEKGIIPFVSTKTYLSEKHIYRIRDIGLKAIQVSIDTLDESVSRYLVGVEGYPAHMVGVIKQLVKAGIKTSTNTVITPYNIKGIPKLVRLLASLGVSRIALSPYGRSFYRHSDDLFLTLEDYDWLSEQVEMLRSEFPNIFIKYNDLRTSLEESPEEKERKWKQRALCSGGKEGLVIHPDGKVTICEELPHAQEYFVGDLSKQSIMEVWESEKLQEFIMPSREKFKGYPCYECDEFEECHRILGRCVRDALKVYGTVYAPPPQCPKAPPTYKRLY